jgi:hypothetical protein
VKVDCVEIDTLVTVYVEFSGDEKSSFSAFVGTQGVPSGD